MLVLYDRGISKIRDSINPFKSEWENVGSTNCYTYALGLDITRDFLTVNSNPGSMSNCELGFPFDYTELVGCLEADFKTLGLSYIEVNSDYILKKDEWKIVLMATATECIKYTDYHFLRQTETGIWTHKQGFRYKPTDLDSRHNVIVSPEKAIIETDGLFLSSRYDYLKTYCLRKK